MLVDEIAAAFAEKGVSIGVTVLPEDEAGSATVVLSGQRDALKMLAMLLLAVAEHESSDGFGIDPRGAGSLLFSKDATHGIYIEPLSEK